MVYLFGILFVILILKFYFISWYWFLEYNCIGVVEVNKSNKLNVLVSYFFFV